MRAESVSNDQVALVGWRPVTPGAPVLAAVLGAALLASGCGSDRFEGDFDAGLDGWHVDMKADCRYDLVATDSGRALRIVAPRDSRCEVVPGIYAGVFNGFWGEPYRTERRFEFSVLVEDNGPADAPPDGDGNTVVAQWHSSPDYLPGKEASRGPPLALRIVDDRWAVTYGWDTDFKSAPGYRATHREWVGSVETGRWVNWSFRVVWNYGDSGLTEVRRDGQLVFRRSGPNVYNDMRGVYLKLGLYHPTNDKILRLDNVRVGPG